MSIKTVGVIGAGTMGAGIALVCARKGHQVMLLDANQAVLDKALVYLESILTKDVEKNKISEQEMKETLELVQLVSEMEQLADCDIVIEAVPERLDLKKSIFSQLSGICRED
ncbi:3-hydroxyacyl-CoA dehydrogenase family protein, partial [Brevibacillus sp. NRRL NRS-603]